MNYNEIRRLYDNVDNDELVTQTAYEFKLFDDYYYQLFYNYSVTNSEDNYMIFLIILLAEIGASLYYFFLMSKLLDCYFVEKDQRGF